MMLLPTLPLARWHQSSVASSRGLRGAFALALLVILSCMTCGVSAQAGAARNYSSLFNSGTQRYPDEVRGMLVFRDALTDDPGQYLPSWNITTNPDLCQWEGITCFFDGHIIYIEVFNIFLGGTISPGIANVTLLRLLDLHSTDLTGPIPNGFASLPNLVTVKLHLNKLNGTIPTGFGRPTLRTLTIYYNNFTGEIPDSLWNATSLRQLNLFDNNLTGAISSKIGNLKRLATLRLSNNGFTGSIPEELGSLSQLNYLGLANNKFTGPVPSSLFQLGNLSTIELDGNQLNGSLPSTIWQLRDLSSLTLGNNKFSGTFPEGVANLTKLETVDIHGNNFSGPIPSDLGNVTTLATIDFSDNSFSGSIPDLSGLASLTYLDLSGNLNLTGPIPAGLPSKLETLRLQGGHWEGPIPDSITSLTGLKSINLTYNYFNGTVSPAVQTFLENLSGQMATTQQAVADGGGNTTAAIPRWVNALEGNCLQSNETTCDNVYNGICFLPLQRSAESCVTPLKTEKKSHKVVTIIILCIVGVAILVGICAGAGLYALARRKDNTIRMQVRSVSVKRGGPIVSMRVKRGGERTSGEGQLPLDEESGSQAGHLIPAAAGVGAAAATAAGAGITDSWSPRAAGGSRALNTSGVPELSLEQLSVATDNFSTPIGNGSMADVYLARLGSGEVLAAKVLHASDAASTSDAVFADVAASVYRLQHPQLACLAAFCQESGTRALIYQYVPGGSLYDRLHGGGPPLSWQQRLRIAVGVAVGVDYLHHGATPPTVHGEIKSSNVLLTEDGAAKLADSGISKELFMGPLGSPFTSDTSERGVFGYVDTDHTSEKKVTEKNDVYSFGVLLFELVTGRKAMDEDRVTLRYWVHPFLESQDKLVGLLDPALLGSVSVQELEIVVAVAQACTEKSKLRPSMTDAKNALVERLGISEEEAAPREAL